MALDELGRGTATLDGAAIAGAVLEHMANGIGCRGLFATHYHHLSAQHEGDPRVAIMHMACAVSSAGRTGGAGTARPSGEAGDSAESVTFLYKLAEGACPKSYGTNVARLAGLPEVVVRRAAAISGAKEEVSGAEAAGAGAGQEAMEVDGEGAEEEATRLASAVRAAVAAAKGLAGGKESAAGAKSAQQAAAACLATC